MSSLVGSLTEYYYTLHPLSRQSQTASCHGKPTQSIAKLAVAVAARAVSRHSSGAAKCTRHPMIDDGSMTGSDRIVRTSVTKKKNG